MDVLFEYNSSVLFTLNKPVYAFIPSKDQIVKPEKVTWQKDEDKPAFDLWGRTF
ncbi:hypothetical protein RCG23_12110 [Neobacillus sp. PS3-34]|uniref:hypothetical protein n=1 Tax=Neobacillus sp. PS3-34 TaxID=3070678 RepID=UPI0027E19D14|nr:hypothetical protein [Neobacillus sp. PS3-34]WML50394.1 hypothetical protein RCG23_12110 [Neobacillus sp. PS3-34]